MFVRWKRRQLRRSRVPEYVRYAVLVRSNRVDGKPRQQVIRHLAHIREKYLTATAHREWFWERVDWHLGDLGLDEKARQSIERTLLPVVPRPTAAELDRLQADRRVYERSLRRR